MDDSAVTDPIPQPPKVDTENKSQLKQDSSPTVLIRRYKRSKERLHVR